MRGSTVAQGTLDHTAHIRVAVLTVNWVTAGNCFQIANVLRELIPPFLLLPENITQISQSYLYQRTYIINRECYSYVL